jgi:ribosome-associated heat shock protein Hsp15
MPSRRWRTCGVAESLRLDKFLWFARIVKTRALAQKLAEGGRLRIDGRVVDKAHAPVREGDVLSFAVHGDVRVLKVEKWPSRRGAPAEARALYSSLCVAAAEAGAEKGADSHQ